MDKNWTTWNTQAMQALDRGDIEQAERAFRQACGSGDPRADSNLGWFYFLMGGSVRDSEAEARYWIQKALQRSRHPLILQNIARLRFENGDFAGALAALQEAYQADQSPVLLYNLGVCHFWLGDKAAAAACFREADAVNAADLLCAQCGAVHPRLAYAFCVQGEERTAALRRYAPERNDMELWDYVLLCVQCEAYAMVAPVLPELVSQWALTDQTLATTALCLQHVPAGKGARPALLFGRAFGGAGQAAAPARGCGRVRAPCGKPAIFSAARNPRGVFHGRMPLKSPPCERKMQRRAPCGL